ncbi:transcriptional regulator [Opitutaceae bacterium TAV1]|nr:transcriptional regulator [Opitutaceae bacterium TAV1]
MGDVARSAGVHPSTVSRALRNDRRIPEATRRRIRQAAEALDYRPNPLVAALVAGRRRRSRTGVSDGDQGGDGEPGCVLAFLTAWKTRGQWRGSRLYAAVFDAMQRHARRRGYALEEFWLGEPGMTPARLRRILIARGIRGIVVCPLPAGTHTLAFDFSGFAAVSLGYTLREPALDHVSYDYCAVLKEAIRRLRERGFRRIGFITTRNTSDRVAHLSLGAFLAERCLEPRRFPAPLVAPAWRPGALAAWVRGKRPDVVITPTQAECVALRTALEKARFRMPADVSLACLDCHDNSREGGMVRDTDVEACAVVELLAGRVERGQEGVPDLPQTILVGGRWRDGASLREAVAPAR